MILAYPDRCEVMLEACIDCVGVAWQFLAPTKWGTMSRRGVLPTKLRIPTLYSTLSEVARPTSILYYWGNAGILELSVCQQSMCALQIYLLLIMANIVLSFVLCNPHFATCWRIRGFAPLVIRRVFFQTPTSNLHIESSCSNGRLQ